MGMMEEGEGNGVHHEMYIFAMPSSGSSFHFCSLALVRKLYLHIAICMYRYPLPLFVGFALISNLTLLRD